MQWTWIKIYKSNKVSLSETSLHKLPISIVLFCISIFLRPSFYLRCIHTRFCLKFILMQKSPTAISFSYCLLSPWLPMPSLWLQSSITWLLLVSVLVFDPSSPTPIFKKHQVSKSAILSAQFVRTDGEQHEALRWQKETQLYFINKNQVQQWMKALFFLLILKHKNVLLAWAQLEKCAQLIGSDSLMMLFYRLLSF